MNPKALDLQARTQRFATAVIKFCDRLPNDPATREIVGQLLASAGSTDSNYRACRAVSDAHFIAKLGLVVEEADESKGWLELLVRSGRVTAVEASGLIDEANQLVAIFVASKKTAERNKRRREQFKEQQRLSRRRSAG